MKKNRILAGTLFTLLLWSVSAFPDQAIPLLTMKNHSGDVTYTTTLQVLLFMTFLAFLPAMFMTMTSFLRCIIVLSLLRQAVGLTQTPSNQVLVGLSFFMTIFIMSPVFQDINHRAIKPYLDNRISMNKAISNSEIPIRKFMLNATRKKDIGFFLKLSGIKAVETKDQIPFSVIVPSYIISELETAFQIGFIIFIPFLVIDLIVSSTLMAMGMMMVSPMIISLPIKIMLFVMVDGWHLVFQTLVNSFK